MQWFNSLTTRIQSTIIMKAPTSTKHQLAVRKSQQGIHVRYRCIQRGESYGSAARYLNSRLIRRRIDRTDANRPSGVTGFSLVYWNKDQMHNASMYNMKPFLQGGRCTHIHTHTHKCAQVRTHAHTHPCTYARMNAHTEKIATLKQYQSGKGVKATTCVPQRRMCNFSPRKTT